MIVVEASALLEVLLNTTYADRVSDRLFGSGETLHVPHLIDLEVAQVLRRYAASGALTADRGAEALHDLTDFPLIRYPHDLFLPRIWELRHNLRSRYEITYTSFFYFVTAPYAVSEYLRSTYSLTTAYRLRRGLCGVGRSIGGAPCHSRCGSRRRPRTRRHRRIALILGSRYSPPAVRGAEARARKAGWAVKPKLKVWIVFNDKVKFGQGRAALLRLIDEMGSISQAVERFEMSYRNAWGYLRELEQAAGFHLLERKRGGSRAAGTRLTPQGRMFLERYDRFERDLERSLARCFDRAFPSAAWPARRGTGGRATSSARGPGQRKPPRKAT